MPIDLGNIPTGTPPTTGEKLQIRTAIGLGQTDAPTFAGVTLGTAGLLMGGITHVNISGTGGINLTASGTNQNIVLTSSGTGYVSIPGSSNGLLVAGNVTTGVNRGFRAGNVALMRGDSGSLELAMNARISWSDNSGDFTTHDTLLARDAAGILAQRNGTAAQAFRVYNSTDATPATNFDRASFGFTSNVLRIGTEHGGTYTTARGIDFVVGGTVRFSILNTGVLSVAQSLFVASTLKGNLTTNTAYTATTVVPTGYITIYDSTNTPYRVPCVL